MRRALRLLAVVTSFFLAAAASASTISVVIDDPEARPALDGRVIVVISRTEAFELGSVTDASQRFGVSVDGVSSGDAVVVDGEALGYPLRSLDDVPAGDYHVRAWMNVYTTFERADGHVVKLPADRGEGQVWSEKPGNLVSDPVVVRLDPASDDVVELRLSSVLPPIEPPAETEWVKNFEMVSERVSEFWGQEMRIGARVLLPRGYGVDPDRRYPVVIEHGHFSRDAPGRFMDPADVVDPENMTRRETMGTALFEAWTSDDFPRFLLITIQHATPYYDDSYAVNTENHGPWGDAIVKELLPAIEAEFNGIGEPWARILTGGSTGGWEAIAQQVFYPDDFGGAWIFYPDQVDFHYYQLVDLYEGTNAYYREYEWLRTPIGGARDVDGRVRYTMEDENLFEEVIGTRYRGGGQWAAWNATFAPVADDGYPAPIWDPITGEIDREVAQWAIEHWDLRRHMETNWETLAPKLAGKLNVFTGRRDNFFLEQAVYELEEFLSTGENLGYPARFEYGEKGNHGWSPWREPEDPRGLYGDMMDAVRENAPDGAVLP